MIKRHPRDLTFSSDIEFHKHTRDILNHCRGQDGQDPKISAHRWSASMRLALIVIHKSRLCKIGVCPPSTASQIATLWQVAASYRSNGRKDREPNLGADRSESPVSALCNGCRLRPSPDFRARRREWRFRAPKLPSFTCSARSCGRCGSFTRSTVLEALSEEICLRRAGRLLSVAG